MIHRVLAATLALAAAGGARAHTTYGGVARDLGPSAGSVPGVITGASLATPYFKTLTNQTVTSNYGWAFGTQELLGDAHKIRAFRFTLEDAGWVTLTASAAARGSGLMTFLPALSIYSGLLHTVDADYDTSQMTLDHLATLGGTQPKRGALDSLGTWKIGNDSGELSTLTYVGNAADGTAANFGSAAGIRGDGTADGSVTGSWWLPAGDYTVVIGGADLAGSDTSGTYGIDVSLTVVPEPSSMLLVASAAIGITLRRRRSA